MRSERGLHRLVSFSDAVVAIAITLLILPLVDAASSIGSTGLGQFLDDNWDRLLAFSLSFAVIGSFWWAQHQMFEGVKRYNVVMVWGMFLWMFGIVFLPFPTELLGSAKQNDAGNHGIYVGTMLVTAIGALVQQWSIVRWPESQTEAQGKSVVDHAFVLVVLMATAFVLVVTVPAIGLWPLLLLVVSRPVESLLARRRTHHDDRVEARSID
jgi:uncharacterized membrane protein